MKTVADRERMAFRRRCLLAAAIVGMAGPVAAGACGGDIVNAEPATAEAGGATDGSVTDEAPPSADAAPAENDGAAPDAGSSRASCRRVGDASAGGVIDTTFGDGGLVVHDNDGGASTQFRCLVADAQGRIIIGGGDSTGGGTFVRLLPNGSDDPTFGPLSVDGLVSCALDSGDRLVVVAGQGLLRFDADGHPDPGHPDPAFAPGFDAGGIGFGRMVIAADDRIHLVGETSSTTPSITHVVLAEVLADGTIANAGTTVSSFNGYVPVFAAGLLGNGELGVAAYDSDIEKLGPHIYVGAFDSAGAPDPKFSAGGWATISGSDFHRAELVLYCDGSITVVTDGSVVRLLPNGAVDSTQSLAQASWGPGYQALADGPGFLYVTDNAIARVVDDQKLDPTFGTGGIVAFPAGFPSGYGPLFTRDGLGRIVIANRFYTGGAAGNWGLTRILP